MKTHWDVKQQPDEFSQNIVDLGKIGLICFHEMIEIGYHKPNCPLLLYGSVNSTPSIPSPCIRLNSPVNKSQIHWPEVYRSFSCSRHRQAPTFGCLRRELWIFQLPSKMDSTFFPFTSGI